MAHKWQIIVWLPYLKPGLSLQNVNTTVATEGAVLLLELGVRSGTCIIQGLADLGCEWVVREWKEDVRVLLIIQLTKLDTLSIVEEGSSPGLRSFSLWDRASAVLFLVPGRKVTAKSKRASLVLVKVFSSL